MLKINYYTKLSILILFLLIINLLVPFEDSDYTHVIKFY